MQLQMTLKLKFAKTTRKRRKNLKKDLAALRKKVKLKDLALLLLAQQEQKVLAALRNKKQSNLKSRPE